MRGVLDAHVPVQMALLGLRAMHALLQLGDWVLSWPVQHAAEAAVSLALDLCQLVPALGVTTDHGDALVKAAVAAQTRLAVALYAASGQGPLRTAYNEHYAAAAADAASGGDGGSGGAGAAGSRAASAGSKHARSPPPPSSWPSAAQAPAARAGGVEGGGVGATAAKTAQLQSSQSSAAPTAGPPPIPKFAVGERVKARWLGGLAWCVMNDTTRPALAFCVVSVGVVVGKVGRRGGGGSRVFASHDAREWFGK
jgi:hypothetical protein